MKNIGRYIGWCLVAVGCIYSSCTDDLGIEGNRPSDVVCFTATLGSDSLRTGSRSVSGHLGIEEEEWRLEGMPEAGGSRASLTTSLTGTAGVMGYSEGSVLSSLKNVEFTFDGDELSSATPVYWKDLSGNANIQFYAYAPYSLSLSGKTFAYAIPEVASQVDIIVAESGEVPADYRQTVPLTFTHALTAVRFKLASDIDAGSVSSITISGVYNQGNYTIGEGWSGQSGAATYTITETGEDNILMLMPQTLPEGATVTLTYSDNSTIVANLEGEWEEGKLITYTLHKGTPPSYIYFDLAAGSVTINASSYSGKIYVNGEAKDVTGTHNPDNIYYVYQSTTTNCKETGWEKTIGEGTCRIPAYQLVEYDGKLWSDFITNNTDVDGIIDIWHKDADQETAGKVGRTYTVNNINVSGQLVCNMTIDNLYSVKQTFNNAAADGGIIFNPSGTSSQLKLNFLGDNRFGNIYYESYNEADGHQLVFEGTGSLTVADADGQKSDGTNANHGGAGYISNWWKAVIGADDGGSTQNCYGLVFKSGVIFAGSTKAENCGAIGGGGNGHSTITIEGGTITAVATTTAATIGGGIGFSSAGGKGKVTITGGNVYAYNFANRWDIPSAAIGGGGSKESMGSLGTVTITGGNVYAQSAIGTAIGGGSSYSTTGGAANVTITGGKVVAKSIAAESGLNAGTIIPAGAGIGGGTGSSSSGNASGGNATVTISGNPIIRTGSVGGGKKGNQSTGTIGSATIKISGTPDIQAQFVMAAGTASGSSNSFTMEGGTIRNSNTNDEEYIHIQKEGGAVWLENGSCSISGGTIENCTATEGGAIYIKGSNNPTFTMSGGEIRNNTSQGNGGAVYLQGGTVTLTGGIISDNLAQGGNGGGIYIKEGSFKMDGTEADIRENSAILRSGQGGNGGGLYVTSATSSVTVDILSGNITKNTSDHWGGGVCVDMSGTSQAAHVKVGTSGTTNPDISENHTLLSGGGLYVSGTNADITINGGKIMDNTTSAYVANVNVANEGGMVTLNDGDVTHNVVTFYANGGQGGPDIQNIVTATNSLLVAPTFTRVGYSLVGWNTRADGRGVDYTNGQVMNISEDLELYAQWKID